MASRLTGSSAPRPGGFSIPSFPLSPTGYKYRPLKEGISPAWDVYALQKAINEYGIAVLASDGYFGPKTHSAVVSAQKREGLYPDGVAGVLTQRVVCLKLIWPAQSEYALPSGLLRGQIESESAFWLGNHSYRYENGTYDIGAVQLNTLYHPDFAQGFDPAYSVDLLGKTLRERYTEYRDYGRVTDKRRLWELASGSWNRPAWTQKLAKGGTLTAEQSDWIERYVDRTTAYMVI